MVGSMDVLVTAPVNHTVWTRSGVKGGTVTPASRRPTSYSSKSTGKVRRIPKQTPPEPAVAATITHAHHKVSMPLPSNRKAIKNGRRLTSPASSESSASGAGSTRQSRRRPSSARKTQPAPKARAAARSAKTMSPGSPTSPGKKSARLPPDTFIVEGVGVYQGPHDADGQREGVGKLWYKNGDLYYGDWAANEKHGTGKMTYRSGHVYEGCFDHDKRQGYGTYTLVNGDVYSGAWEDDIQQGIGHFRWADKGETYEGQFEAGRMHGRGTYTHADGSVYTGHFEHGERQGRGVLIMPDGTREKQDGAPPSYRPDLAIKRDPAKEQVEKMLKIEAHIEKLQLEAAIEQPTGEDDEWDPMSGRGEI
jgi:hypothetical protein